MRFASDGKYYDTCDMYGFDTGTRHRPFVFITRDLANVFVQTMDRWRGVAVHEASVSEIRRLWEAYHRAELLRVLAVRGGSDAAVAAG